MPVALELEPAIRGFKQNLVLCEEEATIIFHDGKAPPPPQDFREEGKEFFLNSLQVLKNLRFNTFSIPSW
jgi:hypothetical protein